MDGCVHIHAGDVIAARVKGSRVFTDPWGMHAATADNEAVYITTRAHADNQMVSKSYSLEGLIVRLTRYVPKGTDLSSHTTRELDAVAHALNTRPRKTLGWKTPAEALNDHLLSIQTGGVATTP